MDRERLDTWCERLILGLVMAVLVYAPLPLGSVRIEEFVVVEWLTAAILAVWFFRFAINPKHRLLWPPLNWAVLAFMSYAVYRYATSDIEYLARQELLRVLVYGSLYFAIVHNLHRQETTQVVVMTLLAVGTVVAMYGIYQHLTGNNYVFAWERPAGYLKRGSGTFYCPNHLAGFLEMLLPLAVVCTLASRLTVLAKVFTGYAAFVMLIGIVFTFSRGGWMATSLSLAVLCLWMFQQRGHRRWIAAVLVSLVLLGVAVAVKARVSPGRFQQIYLIDPREDIRLPMWGVAADMWQQNLWWGVGPGHFNERFVQYRPDRPDTWRFQPRMGWVHNDYLNALVDWGLVGALLVAAAFGLFFWQVAKSWRHVQRSQNDLNVRRSNRSAVVIGGTVGLIAILIHSGADFNFQIPANAIVAVTLLALVAGHFRFASERFWHTVRWPLRIPVTLLLMVLIGYLSLQAWRGTREGLLLKAVRKATYASKEHQELLQQAFAIESKNWETAYRLGEVLRLRSFQSPPDYRILAEKSLPWFETSARLNRFDPLPLLQAGMSLDWLGRHPEAGEQFARAQRIDPNGYYTRALNGWHCFQTGDYEKAHEWFEASLKVQRVNNPIATTYLKLVEEKLAQKVPVR